MVSADKFFVYGGGRWREVDTGSGRIDGWGRAKFIVSRGGKLQATRSRPVLSALRKLADKKTSAAKASLRLPEKITQRHVSRERDARVGCTHCQCCHHINTGSSCSTKPAENKASVAIQCDELKPARGSPPRLQDPLPLALPLPLPRDTSKRKRDSTSSENLFHTKVLTVATVHSPRKPEPKRRSTTSSNKSPKKVGLKRKRQISSSSDDSRALSTLKRSLRSPGLKLRRPGPLKRKRRSSTEETSPVLQAKISLEGRMEKPKHKKVRQDESSSDERLRRTSRQHPSIVISSDESDSEPNLKSRTRSKSKTQQSSSTDKKKPELRRAQEQSSTNQIHKIGPKRTVEKTSINEPLKHKVGPKKALEPSSGNPQNKQNSGPAVAGRSQQESPKELMIDEQDVHILRLFLQKHYPDEELLRFDTDDKHKMLHFYQINPLVYVERCPRVAAAAAASRADSERGELSVYDFASKLGLQYVSEPSSTKPKRYRTRRKEDKSGGGADESGSEHAGAEDKENTDRLLTRRKIETKKVLRESLKRNKSVVVREYRESDPRRGDNSAGLLSGNEAENVKGVKIANVIAPRPEKAKRKASTRSGHNEYSNLEDHAIVSWVSAGGRACSVNGNRLWRQLQEQFHRITGRGRTWHSLRNRYLRYILPGLDQLALPHAQQARLRAAASTGELKARRKQPRRNSIFTLPPRGASSRRRAVQPGDISDEPVREQQKQGAGLQEKDNAGYPPARSHATRAASSSYSDITRQFAQSQRALEQRSSERSAGAPPPRPRRSPGLHSARKPASETSRKQSLSPRRHSSTSSSPRDSNWSNSSSESSGGSLKNERRLSNRHKSPSEPNRRRSNRHNNSLSEPNRRRSKTRNSSSEPNKRKSNRHTSPSEPNRRRSKTRNSPSEPNKRKSIRHTSPSEPNRRRSKTRNSPSEPNKRKSIRHTSPSEPNRRSSKTRNSTSEPNKRKSIRHTSPSKPNRRRSKTRNSPSEPNKRKSIRHTSPSEPNRRSSKTRNSTSEPNKRKSIRHTSPSEPNRRRSKTRNSPSEPNKRKSIRHTSPSEPNRRSSKTRNSPSEPNKRKSIRHTQPSEPNRRSSKTRNSPSEPIKRKSNRHTSPSEPNRRVLNRTSSPSECKLDRNKSSSESSINSSPRGSSHGHTSPESSRCPPTPPDRQLRRRKLFNPATVL